MKTLKAVPDDPRFADRFLREARTLARMAHPGVVRVLDANVFEDMPVSTFGDIAISLTLFVCVTLAVHGTLVFGAARLLRLEPDVAAVASR